MIKHILFGLMIFLSITTVFSRGTNALLPGALLFVTALVFGKEAGEHDGNE